ncbi:MAG: hypothetical protein WEA09_05330 [Gemmatimonadota bacterium]
MSTRDAGTTLRFMTALYGSEAPGFLVLFTLPHSRAYAVPGNRLEQAAVLAARLAQQHDVYAGVGLQGEAPHGTSRGNASGVVALPGFWGDLDLRTPYRNRTDLPTTVEEATAFLGGLPLPPSGIVHSGGGLYPWWCFRELWILDSDAEREMAAELSRDWQRYLLDAAMEGHGWQLDFTPDLARVLRVPGTLNWKGSPPAPVRLLQGGGPRFGPKDFAGYKVPPPRVEGPPLPMPDAPKGKRYVAAAIEAECRELARTPEGSRNARLNAAAFSLARFITAGETDAYQLARVLAHAAARAGLGEREIARTLESAFSARGAT